MLDVQFWDTSLKRRKNPANVLTVMVWYSSGRLWHVKGSVILMTILSLTILLITAVEPNAQNEAVAYPAVKFDDNELKTLVVICGGVHCQFFVR